MFPFLSVIDRMTEENNNSNSESGSFTIEVPDDTLTEEDGQQSLMLSGSDTEPETSNNGQPSTIFPFNDDSSTSNLIAEAAGDFSPLTDQGSTDEFDLNSSPHTTDMVNLLYIRQSNPIEYIRIMDELEKDNPQEHARVLAYIHAATHTDTDTDEEEYEETPEETPKYEEIPEDSAPPPFTGVSLFDDDVRKYAPDIIKQITKHYRLTSSFSNKKYVLNKYAKLIDEKFVKTMPTYTVRFD